MSHFSIQNVSLHFSTFGHRCPIPSTVKTTLKKLFPRQAFNASDSFQIFSMENVREVEPKRNYWNVVVRIQVESGIFSCFHSKDVYIKNILEYFYEHFQNSIKTKWKLVQSANREWFSRIMVHLRCWMEMSAYCSHSALSQQARSLQFLNGSSIRIQLLLIYLSKVECTALLTTNNRPSE